MERLYIKIRPEIQAEWVDMAAQASREFRSALRGRTRFGAPLLHELTAEVPKKKLDARTDFRLASRKP